ncbi:hypothetical protein FRB91_006404 [Serendipita sp. 411]|nr:hypothetical protein FRB91_006404 [Serendipita sp. 411]
MLASRLHPVQKTARMHFETSYPDLLNNHMGYMEQVKHLIMSNATHRSEFATTIACDANAEKLLADSFSTADAIAVSYQKMELEKDRREYRHAPVLNPVSRELEEGCSVILGCYLDPMETDNVAEGVIIECLERYLSLYQFPSSKLADIASWEYCWEAIHMMEMGYGVREILLGLSQWKQAREMIRVSEGNGIVLNIRIWVSFWPSIVDNLAFHSSISRTKELWNFCKTTIGIAPPLLI